MRDVVHDIKKLITLLEQKNELIRVREEVDPILEINAILNTLSRYGNPAVLFENVKGTPLPVLANALGTLERFAWAFGHDRFQDIVGTKLWDTFLSGESVTPEVADPPDVPVLQSYLESDQINLDQFPFLRFWPEDGGRYITSSLVIFRDPDTGQEIVTSCPVMKKDKTHLLLHWFPKSHGERPFKRVEACVLQGKEIACAVVVGASPVFFASIFSEVTEGENISAFARSVTGPGNPPVMVRSAFNGLMVPKDTQIVFEGTIAPGHMSSAGPFAGYNGYYSPIHERPVLHVKGLSMQREPVWHLITNPTGTYEEARVFEKAMERLLLSYLQTIHGGIRDINFFKDPGLNYFWVISLNKDQPGQGRDIMRALWQMDAHPACRASMIVVDGEVDVHDLNNVFWAVSTHVRPENDVIVETELKGESPDRNGADPESSVFGLDATTKMHEEGLRRTMPGRVEMAEGILKKIERHWASDGFR